LEYSFGARVVVELGCYEGKTSVALAKNGVEVVYSIDPFPRGRLGIAYGELITRMHRRRARADRLVLLKGYSFEIVRTFDREVDFLFIDADHSYQAVRRDWLPKVAGGGHIALHDCKPTVSSPDLVGSVQFCKDDLLASQGIEQIDGVDSLAIFRVTQ
jgi:hypothetical protein